METRDGFIIGIHDYCDRWCERCVLTHRCRLFADERHLEFHLGPALVMTGERPRLSGGAEATREAEDDDATRRGDVVTAGAARHEMRDGREGGEGEEGEAVSDPRFDADARVLQARVHAVTCRLRDWSLSAPPAADPRTRDACEVLNYYWLVASAKLYRALSNARQQDGGRGTDADGSARVVLVALERLEEAWLRLAESGRVAVDEAESGFRDLATAKAHLERRFPRARSFVRPGLDEPVAVAMLEWQERG